MRDELTIYLRITANNENWAINQFSWQGKDDSSVRRFNSSMRLPFCEGILQFWTTNQQRPEPTSEQRTRENTEAVDDTSKKFDKIRTVRGWGIKISWHPHYDIYPCELRDWLHLSWHPHPTICRLRWWVSEWESTSIRRERLLVSCLGLWKRDRGVQIKRQNIQESEQMITTEEQIMPSGKEERFFYSTGQFFKEIAISWRNYSILNDDELTTTLLNVRVQRNREKLYEVHEKRKGLVKNNVDGDCQCHRSLWSSGDVWHAISYQERWVQSKVHLLLLMIERQRSLINVTWWSLRHGCYHLKRSFTLHVEPKQRTTMRQQHSTRGWWTRTNDVAMSSSITLNKARLLYHWNELLSQKLLFCMIFSPLFLF